MDNFNKGLWSRVGDVYKIIYEYYNYNIQTVVIKEQYGGVSIRFLENPKYLEQSLLAKLVELFDRYRKYRFSVGLTKGTDTLYIKIN